jgi:PAS domain S-box-containing protein
MNDRARIFSNDELLGILSLSPNATAIYTTEDLIIQTANDAMIGFWGKDRSVIGKTFEEAVPELKGQPFFDLLRNVWRTGLNFEAIDTPAELRVDGKLQTFYFDLVYRAIKNENGQVYCILHTASDVTERIATREYIKEGVHREQQLNEELATVNEELTATNEELAYSQNDLIKLNQHLEDRIERRTKALTASENRLNSMVMTAPIGMTILRGRELLVEIANDHMLEIWNRKHDEIVGKPLMEVFPDLVDQPFPALLASVFDTGKKVAMPEIEAIITSPQGNKNLYLDFSYDPLFDAGGNVESIMATVIDITETVKNRKEIEESEKEQQSLNEELFATNEELAAANEELITSNEELAATQDELKELLEQLSESEAKFRMSVQQAPVAMAVLSTREMLIESANESMLQVWGKTDAIRGLPLAVGIPELIGQPFLQILDNVYTTGETFYGSEARVELEHDGRLGEYYFDFIYKALRDKSGEVNKIIVVAVNVTGQVNARNELQRAEEMLRFSVEAANVGTWFLDAGTREFVGSERLKELFGFHAGEEVTYEMFVGQIPDDYRQKITDAVEASIASGESYTMVYPVTGYHDGRRRWIRAIGKLYDGKNNKSPHLSGLVIDVTEQKEDELRKNDFIGMVSHELKTPLTSLSAIVQMLNSKAKANDDKFTAGALDKAYTQARKMSAMINGFLNISRLESGKMHINKQVFNLDELLRDMVDETRLTAASHLITLHTAKHIAVNADQDKIASVISNLLSNAVKYSERGTTIEVRCKIDDNKALVSVKDEGLGIKQQDIDKLFDRYYRVESSNTRHISGFGIGLYLSSEIIDRHNGNIWVESEMDKGSTFYFTLPLK